MKAKTLFHFIVGVVVILTMGLSPTRSLAESQTFTSTYLVTNLEDSGPGSFRQAILDANASPGEDSITFSFSGVIHLASVLGPISDALVIDGFPLDITLSGDNLVRLLDVQAGVNVSLANLTFSNGQSFKGGAIYNQGILRLEDCVFTANSAEDGGAIYNTGELWISGCLFEGNNAIVGGGAIWSAGQLEIDSSILRNNTVTYDLGGALDNRGQASITASHITGNSVNNLGGGIYNKGRLDLVGSDVSGNFSKWGGGIHNDASGVAVLRFTSIQDNGAQHWGGGIDNLGEMTVYSSQVLNNQAVNFGGGIYNTGDMNLEDTKVADNRGYDYPSSSSQILGGGIYNEHDLTLTRGVVITNHASLGGGIYNQGSLKILDNSQISQNTAEVNGGGVFNLSILDASQATFDHNEAKSQDGGGIFNDSAGVADLSDCQVVSNAASLKGGGVFNLGEFNLLRSQVNANFARDMGAGVYSSGKTSLDDSTVSGNSSWNYGGGIFNSGEMSIAGSLISTNHTWTGGGMINWWGGNARMVNSTISGNYAEGWGGGFENDGVFTVTYSTIKDNYATWEGQGSGFNNKASLSIGFSLLANDPHGGNCNGVFTAIGTNISDDDTCPGSKVSDPRLGPLKYNGGPTQTHALLARSPALDAAEDPNCPAVDQRGQLRPRGLGCDLGAFEASQVKMQIDINPKTSLNPIDLTSNAAIPVAILSTPAFNAPRRVVQVSLTFGLTGLEDSILHLPSSNKLVCSAEDINGDRLADLVCHFKIKSAGFTCQATRGILRAELLEGLLAVGSDAVKVTRCR